MLDNNISILLKLFVLILVMYIFYLIINKISKSFATQCPSGQTYDTDQKKCIVLCTDSTPFYNKKTESCQACENDDYEYLSEYDKCLPKCYNKERCGEYCMDSSQSTCIKDRTCLNSHVYRKPSPSPTGCTGDSCTGATGSSQTVKSFINLNEYHSEGPIGLMLKSKDPEGELSCCPEGQFANSAGTGCQNQCPTGTSICGNDCIDTTKNDCVNNQKCQISNVYKDSNNNKLCCKSGFSDTLKICCPHDINGNDSYYSEGGHCYINCASSSDLGPTGCKLEKEDINKANDLITQGTGAYGQFCLVLKVGNKTEYGCINKTKCTNLKPLIKPELEDGKLKACAKSEDRINNSIYPYLTCDNKDSSQYFYYAQLDTDNNKNCNKDDCIFNMRSYKGLTKLESDTDTSNNLIQCKGTSNCQNYLDSCNGTCPVSENEKYRCCTDESKGYEGLLCSKGKICGTAPNGTDDKYSCYDGYYTKDGMNFELGFEKDVKDDSSYYDPSNGKGSKSCGNTIQEAKDRCACANKDYFKKVDGNCYYYNPPVNTGKMESIPSGPYGGSHPAQSLGPYKPKYENTDAIKTSYSCNDSGGLYEGGGHYAICENTTNVPEGVYYCSTSIEHCSNCNCDDKATNHRCSQGIWTKCDKKEGCNVVAKDASSTNKDQFWYVNDSTWYKSASYCADPTTLSSDQLKNPNGRNCESDCNPCAKNEDCFKPS